MSHKSSIYVVGNNADSVTMKVISLLITNLKDILHLKEEEYVLLNHLSKKYVQGWREVLDLADCGDSMSV